MKLFPQHLRDRQHAEIVRRRTYGLRGKGDLTAATGTMSGVMSNKPLPEPQTGLLGRFWAKGSGLTPKQAATGLPASSASTLSTVWAIPGLVGSFSFLIGMIALLKRGNPDPLIISSAVTAALSVVGAFPLARWAFKACYKDALNEGEIEHLIETAASTTTPTESAYLRLVRDAVRQNAPVSAETQAEIQSAIVSLGEAIDRLPVLNIAPVDTAALRREADLLQTDAATNLDRVIADSLERRADALLRRADAAERSSLAAKRNAALRAEIEAQIAALHESIAALGSGVGATDVMASANLQHFAESARRLAAETVSVESARAELDVVAVSPEPVTLPTAPVQEPLINHAGSR